ncbi:AAA family ATPase [Paenibacillus sp. GCM10012307]|uniref:AAA family ATPase n=1 Tax=Paenibacillus roseus TaxID=2798579 RepID=A0A934MVU5_9BACL|nr:AAA family ATPase [Paenibacillus roseus]MBJ6362487.1 AAA family ATPase [Paenibacillus roseus]
MIQSIKIKKLIVEGDYYKRTFPFSPGLNIISGDSYSGKSLILKLIDYCLGDKEKINLNVQKELGQFCDYVFLELEIMGSTFTLKRGLKQNTSKIYVYYSDAQEISSFIPKTIDYKDLSRFILDILEIPEFKRIKNKAHDTTKTTESISFRDMFRFVYINQHELGTKNFLNSENPFVRPKNKLTFQLLHKLINPDLDALIQQIVDNENKIKLLEREIESLNQYLKERDAEDQLVLHTELNSISAKINENKLAKKKLLQQINDKKSENNKLYNEVKLEVINQARELSNMEELRRSIHFSLSSKKNLLNDYNKELEEMIATKEAYFHYKYDHHEQHCPLCASMIKMKLPVESQESINQAISQLTKKISTLASSIQQNESTLNETNSYIEQVKGRKDIYDVAFRKFSENIETPFLAEIEVLNSFISSFQNNENLIKEFVRVHRKIEEKNLEISSVDKTLKSLRAQEQGLRVEGKVEEEVLEFLNNEYRVLLNKFNFSTNPLVDYISTDSYMPYYHDASVFDHESGGLVMCIQIAYLGAILKLKIDQPELNHPGLLMFDTVSKYLGINSNVTDDERLDPQSYRAIYSFLIELQDNVQIIIVDNTPPEIASEFVKYEFYRNDLKGFINMDLNEKTKSLD